MKRRGLFGALLGALVAPAAAPASAQLISARSDNSQPWCSGPHSIRIDSLTVECDPTERVVIGENVTIENLTVRGGRGVLHFEPGREYRFSHITIADSGRHAFRIGGSR